MIKLPNPFESVTTPVTYLAGSVIFSRGDRGDSMYVVRQGEVDLIAGGRVVETVGEDGFFGEMALIDNDPRAAGAVARTDCELIPINEKQFQYLSQEIPFFALKVMRGLSRRLRATHAGEE